MPFPDQLIKMFALPPAVVILLIGLSQISQNFAVGVLLIGFAIIIAIWVVKD